MRDLQFEIESVGRASDSNTMIARLGIRNHSVMPVHSIRLHTQIQIEPGRRPYTPAEKSALLDVFGTPEQWRSSIRPLMWACADVVVGSFTASNLTDLQFPICSEFGFSAGKYLAGLQEGEIPLSFLFSGMIFFAARERPQVAPIPWDTEARFRLPVSAWKSCSMKRVRPEHWTAAETISPLWLQKSKPMSDWNPFDEPPLIESVRVFGVELRKGDRVRLWPQQRADILDLALTGKSAVIEAIEQDFEDQVQLAVVLDDDPGRDLGDLRQPGHRFFFRLDEVQPLSLDAAATDSAGK